MRSGPGGEQRLSTSTGSIDHTAGVRLWRVCVWSACRVVGSAVGVVDGYRGGGRIERDPPASFMNRGVVGSAQQDEIVQGGRPALCPWLEVVAVCPAGWPITEREPAAAVAQ